MRVGVTRGRVDATHAASPHPSPAQRRPHAEPAPSPPPTPRRARAEAAAAPSKPQHSMTLTASPPSLVSLYFVDMSMPVCRIVSTTVSRLT